jgi:hypothetical protein
MPFGARNHRTFPITSLVSDTLSLEGESWSGAADHFLALSMAPHPNFPCRGERNLRDTPAVHTEISTSDERPSPTRRHLKGIAEYH